MSYQNGNGHRVVMGGGSSEDNPFLKVKPMDYLEARRRRNRCISFTLLAVFLAVCGSLAVWRIRLSTEWKKAVKASRNHGNDDDDGFDNDNGPSKGLVTLNMHLKRQSKVMVKGCETTLLLMRHCEKMGPSELDANGNEHCSYLGQERSYYISTLFGTRWPTPSKLFALTPGRDGHLNFREYETLHPLSLRTGIPIDIADQDDLARKYFDLLQSGTMCGKLTVVSWKHSFIGEMAEKLGCTPDDGCPKDFPEDSFDQVWQLKYVFYPFAPDDLQEEKEFLRNTTDETMKVNTQVPDQVKHGSGWRVFATVTQQNFDPLAFSYQAGDYPDGGGGSPTGGKWKQPEL